MKRKLVSLVLSLAMAVQATGVTAMGADFAQESTFSDSERESIISTLQFVANAKGDFNLDGIEFSDLYIGDKIQAYEYVESGFEELYSAYPLLYNDELVALAFEVDEGCYQISTHLASKIDDASVSKLSLVYDLSSIYLFDGTEYIWLEDSLATISSRLPLKESAMTRDINLFDMCDLSKTEPLGYYTSPQGRAANYYECSVSYVSQLPDDYDNLCWAATISTIVEYVTGEKKDVITIAKKQHGDDFDQPVNVANIGKILLMEYDVEYSYVNKPLTDAIVLRNIKTDYPVYASFRYEENPTKGHAGTIYGVNVISGFMMVMDPSFGSATMTTKDGTTYSYICEKNGKVLNLYRGVCYSHNW